MRRGGKGWKLRMKRKWVHTLQDEAPEFNCVWIISLSVQVSLFTLLILFRRSLLEFNRLLKQTLMGSIIYFPGTYRHFIAQ